MKRKDDYSNDWERKDHCLNRGIRHLATASNQLSNIFLANPDMFNSDFHEVGEHLDDALLCFSKLKGERILNCSNGKDEELDE